MTLSRFTGLDDHSRDALRRLASSWRDSPTRPSVSGHDALAWHSLIQEWVQDRNLPLLVRRPRDGRGREIIHSHGRILIPTDDAPARYLLSLAMQRRAPSRQTLYDALRDGRMPIATTLSPGERTHARYTGTIATMDAPDLSSLGYKMSHITQIGLRRMPLNFRTEIELIAHTLLFLSPINMFVVPKEYAGVSELREFVDEMDHPSSFAVRPN